MSMIQLNEKCLWGTCLICIATMSQDRNDAVHPESIPNILLHDRVVIGKW